MAKTNRLTLVLIPAFNEAKNIGRVVREIRALGFETLVVDDGSTDGTPDVLRDLDTHKLFSPINQGKGASLRLGFQWFLDHHYEYLVMVDADGQHAPDEIEKFLEALHTGPDIVIGNRLHDSGRMPKLRLWTNRLMSWVLSAVAGQRIPDSQCGFRAAKRKVIKTIRLRRHRFEVESEMLLQAARHRFKIASVPIRSIYEGQGSHIDPLRDTLRFLHFLTAYLFRK